MNLVRWNPSPYTTQAIAKEIVQCQVEIKRTYTTETSLLSRIGYGISGIFTSRKKRTLEDLFNLQEMNISALNNELANTIDESRNELQNLERYVDQRTQELYEAAQKSPERKVDLELFKEKRLNKEERRRFMEALQEYHAANETIVDTAKELEFVDALEDVFRIILHSSERTFKKCERLEQHISNTKLAYVAIAKQQNVVASLGKAIETMDGFSQEIFSLVDHAAKSIQEIANRGFSYNPVQLKSTLTNTSSLNALHAREAERIAKKIRESG